MSDTLDKLRNKIIVSVQAQDNEPLNLPSHLLALCESVINGGAGGLRLCGIQNIKHIKKTMDKSWFFKRWLYKSMLTQYNNILTNHFEE